MTQVNDIIIVDDASSSQESLKRLKIGIVTCKHHPNGAPDDLLMIKLLSSEYNCKILIWDDSSIQWDQYNLLIIRSTWDYVGKFEKFKEWLNRIDNMKIKLLNDSSIIRWNWNKQYLLELEENGIDIVPSIFVKSDKSTPTQVLTLREYVQQGIDSGKFESDQTEFVMKPTVSADAYGTFRFNLDNCTKMDVEFRKHLKQFDMIIQPFVASIQTDGEESFLFFNREFSHSTIKIPAPKDFRVQEGFGGKNTLKSVVSQSDIGVASKVVQYIADTKGTLLFSRVDMLKYKGKLCLSECELFEPSLYFQKNETNIQRFVKAVTEQIKTLEF